MIAVRQINNSEIDKSKKILPIAYNCALVLACVLNPFFYA